jgi:hypothetical protein
MSITRDEALRRFGKRYRSPDLEIYEISESKPKDCYSAEFDGWFIRFSLDALPGPRSSRILCISKSDGQVLYDGSACDEG